MKVKVSIDSVETPSGEITTPGLSNIAEFLGFEYYGGDHYTGDEEQNRQDEDWIEANKLAESGGELLWRLAQALHKLVPAASLKECLNAAVCVAFDAAELDLDDFLLGEELAEKQRKKEAKQLRKAAAEGKKKTVEAGGEEAEAMHSLR